MPLQKPNEFTEFILTPQEIILGSVFSELQLCVIRNELANVARTKINMKYSGEDKEIIQEEAELQGKMNAFNWLLSQHDSSQAEYMQLQLASRESQKD